MVGGLVRILGAGEAALVDAVVDVGEHDLGDLVDLVAAVLGIEVGGAGSMEGPPLGGQVERDLGVVVGDDLAARDVDDGGDRDAPFVAGEAGEVRLLQPFDAEDRVAPSRIEVERPAAGVMRRSGDRPWR